ncbi:MULTISPECIES: RNA polymerase sigma factor [Sphingopyxis]|uniref:RNA polymerase sigma factor n=1 Tax=Sphingopyxis TaxID=165697 RepID=UPI00086E91DC|nr:MULTISPECIES: RNA polymerase sigma factor [Sphingopyxis]APW71561.1 RNA polymerase subunit sigma-24 [Sphingopyxis granuli]AVA15510.1 RNA polymerase subunit sigma-24 [Sphingopyxis sp. MG]ODU28164.1 MAG: RNA polymerase subunit sigma-24 [Sphingopyxis sp. SCN 67-31]
MTVQTRTDPGTLSDVELAARIAARDRDAVRIVTERNNQRLFRVAWSVLKERAEAEDVVQSTYMRGFAAIDSFAGRSSLSTWLTRIAINEALGRARARERRRKRLDATSVVDLNDYRDHLMRGSMQGSKPDAELAQGQIREMLEAAIAQLPSEFRTTFVLREIEGVSVEDAAALLGISPATVKTRCLRARRRLQQLLSPELRLALSGSFPFAGADCHALTARVVAQWCG